MNFDDGEVELQDTIADTIDIEEECVNKLLLEKIYAAADKLTEKDKFILYSYFGVFNYKKLNQNQIAEKLKVTQPQISRDIYRILNKIKKKVVK